MAEIILGIEEFEDKAPDYGTEAGFKITTSEQIITLAIDNDGSCCETWGYFMSEDDPEKFVNADLLGVEITDMNRTGRKFNTGWDGDYDEDDIHLDSGEVMFVDIQTTAGTLQFVAYNCHNGYYGHGARIESKQLKHETTL